MTKLSFEEWKNSDEMSYEILDELIAGWAKAQSKIEELMANTGWATAQSKSPEELKDTLLHIVYKDYLEQTK